MLLAPGADSEAQKPTWDAYNPDQVRKKVDLSALRAQQAQEQSTYFDISPNAPGAGGAHASSNTNDRARSPAPFPPDVRGVLRGGCFALALAELAFFGAPQSIRDHGGVPCDTES